MSRRRAAGERYDGEVLAQLGDHRSIRKHRAGLDQKDCAVRFQSNRARLIQGLLDVFFKGGLIARDPQYVELAQLTAISEGWIGMSGRRGVTGGAGFAVVRVGNGTARGAARQ